MPGVRRGQCAGAANRSRVAGERVAGEAADLPCRHAARAERFVEVDGGLVPVEDAPLHAAAAAGVGNLREVEQQGFAETAAAEFRADEEVLEIESGCGEKGGVVEEIQREARGRAVREGQDAVCGRRGAVRREERGGELGLGGDDIAAELLVVGEGADEIEDERDVGAGGGAKSRRDGAS